MISKVLALLCPVLIFNLHAANMIWPPVKIGLACGITHKIRAQRPYHTIDGTSARRWRYSVRLHRRSQQVSLDLEGNETGVVTGMSAPSAGHP